MGRPGPSRRRQQCPACERNERRSRVQRAESERALKVEREHEQQPGLAEGDDRRRPARRRAPPRCRRRVGAARDGGGARGDVRLTEPGLRALSRAADRAAVRRSRRWRGVGATARAGVCRRRRGRRSAHHAPPGGARTGAGRVRHARERPARRAEQRRARCFRVLRPDRPQQPLLPGARGLAPARRRAARLPPALSATGATIARLPAAFLTPRGSAGSAARLPRPQGRHRPRRKRSPVWRHWEAGGTGMVVMSPTCSRFPLRSTVGHWTVGSVAGGPGSWPPNVTENRDPVRLNL